MLVLRNCDIDKILIGCPKGHKHVRTLIFTKSGEIIVLQEATVAGIVRGYLSVALHPSREAIELISRKLDERKKGFAEYQLLESGKSSSEVVDEITKILEGE